MKPSITSLNLISRYIFEAVELENICAKRLMHYHPHSRNCVTLNTSNASVCENNDSLQYNQTYSAAAYSSRPGRFLTPIPKATQAISDSVHGNLSSASVSVPSMFYTNTRSLVNKMDETEVILSQTDTQIFIVSETWFHS